MVQRVEPTEPDDPQVLAEHGRFVRNLAWRLLHDEEAAEEVVQETMLAAVNAKPKADRSLRPWLATVARNVIRKRFRSKARVRRREEAAAKPEAVPSAFDMAARAEMLRDVVDAVLSLDEPNRSTVLLRFYEDLPPREIATQQGVGVETVRGRLKRAIRQLRKKLDRRHGGPQGWAPLLAALTGLEVPAELLGGTAGAASGTSAAAEATPVAVSSAAGSIPGVAAAFLVGAAVCATAVVQATAPDPGTTRASVLPVPTSAPAVPGEAAAHLGAPGDVEPAEADRFTAARRRHEALTGEIEIFRARLATLVPARGDPTPLRAGVAEMAPEFDAIDWPDVAMHVRAMSEYLVEVEQIVSGGEQPTLLQQSKILKHNTPVAAFAVDVGPDLGEPDANLAFTHPTIVANLVRATLLLLEDPLSRDQEIAIRALSEAWHREAMARLVFADDDVPVLQHVLVDLDAKMRFQVALKDVLTASQRAKLYFPATEGRVDLDMLSPGLMFPRLIRHHVDAPTRERLERGVVTALLRVAGIEVEDLEPYAWIGHEWLDAIPEVLEPRTWHDPNAHFPTVDVVHRWLTQQVEAIHRIIATGRLTESEVESLKAVRTLLRPRIAAEAQPRAEPDQDEDCCPEEDGQD